MSRRGGGREGRGGRGRVEFRSGLVDAVAMAERSRVVNLAV